MAPKPTAKQQVANLGYSPTPELASAIAAVDAALARRVAIDAAVSKSASEIETTRQAFDAAADAQAKADADLALSMSEAEHARNEPAANLAADEADLKLRAADRAKRATEALCQKAVEVDGDIATARQALDMAVSQFNDDTTMAVRQELNEAVRALVPLLLRIRALHATTHNRALSNFTNRMMFPDPLDHAEVAPLIDYRFAAVDGANVDLEAMWRADAGAIAIVEGLQDLTDIKRKLGAYRPFVHPDKRPMPYQIKSSSEGPGGRPSAPTPRSAYAGPAHMPLEEAMKAPYEIKASNANQRTVMPQELNVVHQSAQLGAMQQE